MEKDLFKKKVVSDIIVNVNEVSRIAEGAVLNGDLSARNDIRVDGEVYGTLHSAGKVVVGETASLSGAMLCSNTDFWGKMKGDLYIRDVLSLKSNSCVEGNIYVRKFQVEMGARVNGSFKMISENEYDKFVNDVVKFKAPKAPEQPARKSKRSPDQAEEQGMDVIEL